MINPMHDSMARDTSVSNAEGRLRVSVSGKKKRLKKILRAHMDGAGGPGVTKSSFSASEIKRFSSLGVKTGGSGQGGVAPWVGKKKKGKKGGTGGAMTTLKRMITKQYKYKAMKDIKSKKIKIQKIKKLVSKAKK